MKNVPPVFENMPPEWKKRPPRTSGAVHSSITWFETNLLQIILI